MGNTVLGLFGVCIAAALSELLLPGDEARGTKTALRLLVSLSVLLLLLRPFLPYLQKADGRGR
jgi:threonine/homoserine efflux transporter RhtA